MLRETSSVVTTEQIRDALRDGESIYLTNCTIQRTVEVSRVHLPNGTQTSSNIQVFGCFFEAGVYFKEAIFGGNFIFEGTWFHSSVELMDSEFQSEVSFRGAKFSGEVDFSESRFRSMQRGTRLPLGKTYFDGTEFTKTANFSSCTFAKAWFSGAVFGGDAVFSGTVFREEAYFNGARFLGEAKFDSGKAGSPHKGIYFDKAEFTRKADFSNRRLGRARFCSTIFEDEVKFSKENFKDEVDFTRAAFGKEPEVPEMSFDNPIGAKNIQSLAQAFGQSNLTASAAFLFDKSGEAFKNIYEKAEYAQGVEEQIHYYNSAILNYRLSERIYDSIKARHEAGESYKKAMEFKRRHRNPRQNSYVKRSVEWTWLTIMKIICEYGESTGRVILWVLGITTFFALIYTPSGCYMHGLISLGLVFCSSTLLALLIISLSSNPNERLCTFLFPTLPAVIATYLFAFILSLHVEFGEPRALSLGNSYVSPVVRGFYLSFTTFTTLGFGDIDPQNDIAAILVSLEVVCGYVMFGILITLLARRIMRW